MKQISHIDPLCVWVLLVVEEYTNEMNGVLGQGYTGPRTTWANEMNFGMKHAPGAGLIARPVDLQSSMLPLSCDCP